MVIRCPDSNNTNSSTGGTALPKFAIRGMMKTFGLHGVVLDVDSVRAETLSSTLQTRPFTTPGPDAEWFPIQILFHTLLIGFSSGQCFLKYLLNA